MSMQKGKQHPSTNTAPNYASRYQSYPHQQAQQRELSNYSHQLNAQTFATQGQTGVQQTASAGPGAQNNQQLSAGATQPDGPRTPWRTPAPANQQPAPQSVSIGPPSQSITSNPAGPVPNTPGGPPPNSQPPQQPTGIPGGTGGRLHHSLTVPPPPQGPPQSGGSQAQPSPAPQTSTPPADHLGGKPPQCGPPPPTAHMSAHGQLPLSYMNQQPRPPYSTHQFRQATPRMPNHNRNPLVSTLQGSNMPQSYLTPHINFQSYMHPGAPIAMQQHNYVPHGYTYSNQHQQRQQNHAPYYPATAAPPPTNMMINHHQGLYSSNHFSNVPVYFNVTRPPTAQTGPGQQVQQGAQTQPLLPPPQSQLHHQMHQMMPIAIQQPVTQNQQPPAPPPQAKRKRMFALKIINPETKEEVITETDSNNTSPPRSGESSARQTPQPNIASSNAVAADFAAQVYKLATEEDEPVTTQTLTATVESTTTTVAQTITTMIVSSSLKSSPITTTANINSSVDPLSTIVENLDNVSSELEVSQTTTKVTLNEPYNTGSSSIWKKAEKTVDPTPVVSANTNAPAVHVKKMNTSDSSQIKSSSIKNINKSSTNQISTSLSQEKTKCKEEKEKTPPLEVVSKNAIPPTTQIKHTTKGRRNEREKSNSKSRDREPTPTSPVPASTTSDETNTSSSTISSPSPSSGAISREPAPGLLSKEGYRFIPAGAFVDDLSKPLPTKESSVATSVTLSKIDSKTETVTSQVSNNNSLKVSSKVVDSTLTKNTPISSLPDLSNVQPAETTLSQADLKSNDAKDSTPAVCISSSSNSSEDEKESSNKKKSKRGQTGSTNTSTPPTASSTTPPIPVLSNSTSTGTTPLGSASGAPHILPEVSPNQTAASISDQVPTMKELSSSTEDEKTLETKISNNLSSNITQDINSNISNNVSNSSSRPESPIQQINNTEDKTSSSDLNMTVKSNEPTEIDGNIDTNSNDINSNSEISNHVVDSNSETSAPPANKPEVPTRNLKYAQEQWSPVNPTGKKKYGREFLLELKNDPESKKLPDNLPDLDIVIKDINNRDWTPQPRTFDRMSNIRNQHDMLTPNFMRTGGNNPRPQIGKRNSQQGKPKGGNKGMIQFSLSLKDEVKLHESANAWKPDRLKQGTDRLKQTPATTDQEQLKTDDLYKKVRGVLNKLTPQKFETLVTQVKQLPIDNAERLTGVISLVFEKAVDEPSFSVAYAGMCQVLQNMQVPVNNSGDKSEMANFRKILINRCQVEFEKNKEAEIDKDKKMEDIKNCSDPDKKKELKTTLEEEWRRIRMKSLGNIRFIGELYKLSMLTANIMHRCIKHLLNGTDEESLECLCKLLSTIGKDLESKKQDLGPYIDQMKQLASRKGDISSRVRFMVQDVEELRLNHWVPRRDDSNPKTIDQIQKEAERERDQIEMNLTLSSNTPRKDDRMQDRRKQNKMETDWQHVSRRTGGLEMMKQFKQMKGTIDAPLELGHKGKFSQWGGGASTKKEEKKPPSLNNNNKFAALDTSGDIDKRSSERPSNTLGLDIEGDRKRMLSSHKNEGRATPPVSRSHSRDNSSAHRDGHNTMSFSNATSITSSMGSGIQGPTVGSNAGPISREISSTRAIITPTPSVATTTPGLTKTAVKLDEYKIKQHTLIVLDEYLSNTNLEEVSLSVLDNFIVEQRIDFVNELLNQGIERSVAVREHIGNMLAHLVTKDTLKASDVLNGFMNLFEMAEDIIIDVPKFWNFAADILAPIMNSNSISWAQFRDSIKEKNIDCSPILPHLFQIIVKVQTPSSIRQAFEAQKVEFSDFLPPGLDLDKYIKDNKLEYLVSSSPVNIPSLTRQVTEQEIKEKITQLLKAENLRTLIDSFSDWTNINVGAAVKKPAFIRALTTAICEVSMRALPNAYKLNEETFNSLNILLTKYIDNNPDLELQCIYAIQAFVHKLEHPPSLLYDIFNQLWESSIISNEAFFQWENSQDPAEAHGKAVAIKSVVALFTSMKETEDTDED